jgi:adenylate cyclase
MNSPPIIIATDSEIFFKEALAKELLRSEQRRLKLILGFLGIAFGSFGILTLWPGFMADATRQHFREQAPQVCVFFVVVLAYESAILAWVGKLLRTGRRPPDWTRYANALVEVSIPTVILLVAATTFGPVQALAAAPTRFYFLFIIMTALQLDYRISLFSGGIAALQYAGAAYFLLFTVDRSAHPELLIDHGHQLALAGLLLLAGLISGFVASQIRRQVVSAQRSTDDRNRTIGLFGQYVSPEVVEKVLRQPVSLSGELRQVSVLFLDIRNFSAFANSRGPEEVMAYLNHLFGDLVDVVNRHGGIVNKFLGDGFMAIFGAPSDDDQHCNHAVEASFEILKLVDDLNHLGKFSPTRLGIGIHMGEVVTGNVGSSLRKEYTVIGDVVNLASRIEAATKEFNANLLVSQDVRDLLDASISSVDQGSVELKGQSEPVRIHRLV